MSANLLPLAIIFGIVLFGAVIGIYAGLRRTMDLEQWTVAGRGFGLIFVWLLSAGEIYTTFSFLGSSGWVYSRGGPTLYILGYNSLAYVSGFFILPDIWEVGHRFRLHTVSDFFQQRPYEMAHIVINGRSGEIVVNGNHYNGVMPPQDLNDEDVASVINYVSVGMNKGKPALTPAQVKDMRRVKAP